MECPPKQSPLVVINLNLVMTQLKYMKKVLRKKEASLHDQNSNPHGTFIRNKTDQVLKKKYIENVIGTYILPGQLSFTIMIDNRDKVLSYVDIKLYKISTLEEKRGL